MVVRGVKAALIACAVCAAFSAPARGDTAVSVSVGAHGGIHVRELGGARLDLPPGAIRFHTPGGWKAVTRVLRVKRTGRTRLYTVAVVGGRVGELRVATKRAGVMALQARLRGGRVDRVSVAARAPRGERYYGFGERSNAVAQTGSVQNYVSDGPFSSGSSKVVRNTIPPQGFRDRRDATYYPIPWLLSSRGYGVLLTNDQTSTFTLPGARGRRWSAIVAAPRLALEFFAGPTPAQALKRFTALTGRQPAPARAWQFGPWLQTGQENAPPLADQVSDLAKLRAADAPVSAAETQLRYLPCGLDRGNEAYESSRVAMYHDSGLAVLTYVNPMLCASYEPRFDDAVRSGALLTTAARTPSLFNSFVGGTGPAGFSVQQVGEYDFSSRAGQSAFGDVIARIRRSGHDGWMEDFGEYTSLDAHAKDGLTGSALHNVYPRLYHCAVAHIVGASPVVRFQRSGWTGAARCAQDVWGGDPTTSFGFDGLSSAVKEALNMGLSGVSRWGSDIGGYDTIGTDPKLDRELLERWIEFGAVSGVMRIKKSGLAVPGYTRPQVWDPGIVPTWRRYAKLHTQLYPYILAADSAYRRTGMPLMRALLLDYPRDARAEKVDDEFLFGPDLLAAPVVRRGERSRRVYLPAGRWLDAGQALRYDPAHRGTLNVHGARVVRGNRFVRVRAPLGELPLFVRLGSVLPLLTPDVSTLSSYGKQVVRLADRRNRLRLLAFPGPARSAGLFDHEHLRSTSSPGVWRLRIDGARVRHYELQAATGSLRSKGHGRFRVTAVSVNGRRLPRSAWFQHSAGGVLRAHFTTRRGTVVVRGD